MDTVDAKRYSFRPRYTNSRRVLRITSNIARERQKIQIEKKIKDGLMQEFLFLIQQRIRSKRSTDMSNNISDLLIGVCPEQVWKKIARFDGEKWDSWVKYQPRIPDILEEDIPAGYRRMQRVSHVKIVGPIPPLATEDWHTSIAEIGENFYKFEVVKLHFKFYAVGSLLFVTFKYLVSLWDPQAAEWTPWKI